jgi:hypothetical protein
MQRLPHVSRWRLGLVLLLTVVLSGLWVPVPTHAQLVTLTGRVESTDPGPIRAAVVEISPGVTSFLAAVVITNEWGIVDAVGIEADGSFSAPIYVFPGYGYPPASVTLQVDGNDSLHYSHPVTVQVTCSFAPGGSPCAAAGPVLIRQASMYGNIEGTVRDKAGQPVAGAYVTTAAVVSSGARGVAETRCGYRPS